MIKVTIICPVLNEEKALPLFFKKLLEIINPLDSISWKILFVMDKSTDNTQDILESLAKSDSRVTAIVMSSRFGHQACIFAGLEHSIDEDAVIMMDSDLQHPPELIPQLLNEFYKGYDIVYTKRTDTQKIGFTRKWLGDKFYIIMNMISDVELKSNSADFRLVTKKIVNIAVHQFKERQLFLRGLFSWIGYNQIGIEYKANQRIDGKSKYNLIKTISFALDGLTSFSVKPLKVILSIGLFISLFAFLFIVLTCVKYMIDSKLPSGWSTLVSLALFFGGIQLVILGVIGVYISNIYEEIKGRPKYLIDKFISFKR